MAATAHTAKSLEIPAGKNLVARKTADKRYYEVLFADADRPVSHREIVWAASTVGVYQQATRKFCDGDPQRLINIYSLETNEVVFGAR